MHVYKCHHDVLDGRPRPWIGVIPRESCRQRGIDLVEGHALPDHVHLCLSIPPKYSAAHPANGPRARIALPMIRDWRQQVCDELLPDVHGHQAKALADPSFALALARHCHSGKLARRRPRRHHPGRQPAARAAASR